MLILVGLGLCDEKDITLRGLERAKSADLIFLEAYTSKLIGAKRGKIEKLIGKKILEANRELIESGKILDFAKNKKVALLVVGDPLVATTHTGLLLRAKEKKIKAEVIHNASVITVIAGTGLQPYKFGRSVTIPFWEKNFEPTSFYDVLSENKARGLHTLFFLDIKMDQNRFMSPNEAIGLLEKTEQKKRRRIFLPSTPAVVCSRLGSPKESIKYGTARQLKKQNFGKPLHVIIVPGKLHEMEKEFLEKFYG